MRVFATRGVQCVTQARTTSSVQSPAISAAGGSTAVANVRSAAACASAPSDTRPGSAGGAPRRHDTISFFALSIIALPGKLAATFTRRVALHGVRMRRCSLVVRDSGDDAVVSASIERVRGRVRDTAVSAAGDVVADAPADAAALAAALAGGGGDAQRAALVELYVSTGGPGWANRAGWLAPNTSVCTWHGVGCAAGASAVVTSLVLPSNQLVGSLPASLSALSGLQLLVLNNSFITGSLPSTIGALAPLSYLDLSNNALVGSIPDALTSLTALTYVDLDTNGLSGSIPAGVGALTALQVLYLYGNHLGSSIPSTICGLTSVQILYLFSDSLTGSIPACIGNATALQFLGLYDNQLTGTIPESVSSLVSIQELHVGLYSNQLSGTIPAGISNLVSMQLLSLYANQLSGTIPAGISGLSSLQIIGLSANQLSGSIPGAWPPQLVQLYLFSNRLSGSIPESLCEVTTLAFLYLNDNGLSGPIPPCIGQLTAMQELVLKDNRLSGTIPAGVGNMAALELFYVTNNALRGTLPVGLASLVYLQGLSLGNNLYDATPMPTFLTVLSYLSELDLHSANLTGTLPAELWTMSRLTSLDLRFNSLSGTIPSVPRVAVQPLAQLLLANNSLSGSLPSTLGYLSNLRKLSLDNNPFAGCLPSALLCSPTQGCAVPVAPMPVTLQELSLSNCGIVGPLPTTLSNLVTLYVGALLPARSHMLTTPRRIARDNALSGTLPTVNMPTLSVLDVRNNVFSGPLLLPPAVVSATAQNNSFASIAWVSPATTQRVCVFLQAQENPIGGTLDFTLLAPGALVNLSATRFAMTLPNVAAPPSGLWAGFAPADPACLFAARDPVGECGPTAAGARSYALPAEVTTAGPGLLCQGARLYGNASTLQLLIDPWQYFRYRACYCAPGYFQLPFACCNGTAPPACTPAVNAACASNATLRYGRVSGCFPQGFQHGSSVWTELLACPPIDASGASACNPLPFGANSSGSHSLPINSALDAVTQVLAAYGADANASRDALFRCAPGYAGRLCSQCVRGPTLETTFYRDGSFACVQCSPAAAALTWLLVPAAALVVALYALLLPAGGSGAVQVVAFHVQLLAQLLHNGKVSLPGNVSGLFSTLSDGPSLSPFAVDCALRSAGGPDADALVTQYAIVLALPTALALVVPVLAYAAVRACGSCCQRAEASSTAALLRTPLRGAHDESARAEAAREREPEPAPDAHRRSVCAPLASPLHLRNRCVYMALFLLQLTYTSVARKAFAGVSCTLAGASGETFLAAYPWIACGGDATFTLLVGMSTAALAVYVLGVPALFAVLIVRAARGVSSPAFVEHALGFLVRAYRASSVARLWSLVLLARSALLTMLVAVVPFTQPGAQTLGVVAVLLCSVLAAHAVRPFAAAHANAMELGSLYTLLLAYVAAYVQLLQVQAGAPAPWIGDLVVVLAVGSTVALAAAVVVFFVRGRACTQRCCARPMGGVDRTRRRVSGRAPDSAE